jgi:hypothetical protein
MLLVDGPDVLAEPGDAPAGSLPLDPAPWHRFIGSTATGFYWFSLLDGYALREPLAVGAGLAPARAGDSTAGRVRTVYDLPIAAWALGADEREHEAAYGEGF